MTEIPTDVPFDTDGAGAPVIEDALFATLTPTGWHRVSSDPYATSWALLAAVHSGEPIAQSLRAGCRKYLLASQRPDGSWGQTVQERLLMTPHAYVALALEYEQFRAGGDAHDAPAVRRAILAARTYQRKMETVIYQHLPDELMRCFRPLCVLAEANGHQRLVDPLHSLLPPPERADLPASDQICFQLVALCDALPELWQAAGRAEVAALCSRQLENGSWWCVADFTAMALLALTGHAEADHARIQGWEYLRAAQNEDGGLSQFFDSEIFLTAYVCYVYAALAAPFRFPMPERLLSLTPWLRAQQQPSGLWSFTPAFPGGDLDDTAWVVLWLSEGCGADLHDEAVARAIAAMLTHQRPDGSFPSWSGLGGDPDVTAHVLHVLWALGICSPATEHAHRYLLACQREDGSWPATWHISPVYGTAQALHALARGPQTDASREAIRRGAAYLLEIMQSAGNRHTISDEEASMACWGLAALHQISSLDSTLLWQAELAIEQRYPATSPTALPPPRPGTTGEKGFSTLEPRREMHPMLWLAQFRYTAAPLSLATDAALARVMRT